MAVVQYNHPNRISKAKKNLTIFDQKKRVSSLAFRSAAQRHLTRIGEHDCTLPEYAKIHSALTCYIPRLKGKTIVQLGAATGVYMRYLQDQGAQAVSLNNNPQSVAIAKRIGNTSAIRANAAVNMEMWPHLYAVPKYLPFADKSLDCVISEHFLFSNYTGINDYSSEFCGGSRKILRDVKRCLKRNGIAIISFAPEQPPQKQILNKIRKMGFSVLGISNELLILRKK